MAKKKTKNPRRRSSLVDILNGLLSLLVFGILLAGGILVWGAYEFHAKGPLQNDAIFQVERGLGLSAIASRLEDEGLISNQWLFQAGAFAQRKHSNVRAGEFEIAAGASMNDILTEFSEGRPIQYSFTVPPGFSSYQVAERLLSDETLLGTIETLPPEGSVLPETYYYERGTTRAELLARMQASMTAALTEAWEGRDPELPIETPQDLVTLASIIEKETAVDSERPEVAAVFVNRLNANMRLQSDPTIIYGITQGRGPLGRGLTVSEIETETPYNTYTINGLPEGPIASPSKESLLAAANPADVGYYYFVADGTGGHAFAENYDEHRRNVSAWRAVEAERAEAVEADAEAARDALEAQAVEDAGLEAEAE